MSQILSLVAASLYGVADFSGGLAARIVSPWKVTAWSQLIGVPLLLAAVAIIGTNEVTRHDLVLGAFAGSVGLVGLVFMYSALATGTMSVIAPIIGALAAAISVAWDVATGGSISALQWGGIALSVAAVILLASQARATKVSALPIVKGVIAATAFAIFFITMSNTNEASAVWPLVAARVVTIPVAFIIAAVVGAAKVPSKKAMPYIAFTGLADMGASLAIVVALQQGSLAVNTMLASLYPAFTVLAALIVLKERPNVTQRLGIALAFIGAVTLAT